MSICPKCCDNPCVCGYVARRAGSPYGDWVSHSDFCRMKERAERAEEAAHLAALTDSAGSRIPNAVDLAVKSEPSQPVDESQGENVVDGRTTGPRPARLETHEHHQSETDVTAGRDRQPSQPVGTYQGECPNCGGEGKMVDWVDETRGMVPCDRCDGTGTTPAYRAPVTCRLPSSRNAKACDECAAAGRCLGPNYLPVGTDLPDDAPQNANSRLDAWVALAEANDRIESLTAALAAEKAENKLLRDFVHLVTSIPTMTDAQLAELRANALEATKIVDHG